MVRVALRLLKRGWLRFPGEDPAGYKHIKHGPVKWKDYKSPFVDPPYWYKWGKDSPYSPTEQQRIRARKDIGWHRYNYDKINYTPPEKWLFFVGDRVEILTGKDKGKQGEVVQIIPERNWVVVGGMNLKYKTQDGEVHADAEPLEHHEVSLLDPLDKKPTNIEFKADADGQLARVSLRSGHLIPKPLETLHDGTPKIEYINESKDTPGDVALARTFVPSMKSPEDELKELYKVEDPPKKEMFWY